MSLDKLLITAPPKSTTGRVVDVLLAFSSGEPVMGISDIARSTGLSKAVIHRILQELGTRHLVVRDSKSRKYRLGNAAFALSNAAGRSSAFKQLGGSIISALAEETGETATLSGRMGYRRVYIEQVESSQLIRISVQVGLSLPLTVGASGHAILAYLPKRDIDRILSMPIPALSDRTETRPEFLSGRLDEIRKAGYARTEAERVADSVSFASPVFDPDGNVIGAVSVAALASRVDEARAIVLRDLIIDSAKTLTSQISDFN